VSGGEWASAWSALAREMMAAGVDEKGLNLLDNIDRFIRDDQLAALSLESLALDLGVSPQHLSASFKERVGVNFIEYITRRRMRLARRLLQETGLAPGEVARRCGYADPTYFRKLFARYYGVSPHDFRTR
jgi:two-component system response regulator YesN